MIEITEVTRDENHDLIVYGKKGSVVFGYTFDGFDDPEFYDGQFWIGDEYEPVVEIKSEAWKTDLIEWLKENIQSHYGFQYLAELAQSDTYEDHQQALEDEIMGN